MGFEFVCVRRPSKYGVVVYDEGTGKIDRFVEKPQVYVKDPRPASLRAFT
jgi:mannose-1-phosphate guanylyltransferase